MNTTTATTATTESTTLARAFALVCPTRRGAHWKDAIAEYVALAALEEAAVDVAALSDAVEHYTATRARVRPVASLETGALAGYWVEAPGYRAGPAA